MLNLKKTALAVIALGSTAAFAGTMGPVCSAVNVTVPCENTAWDLGGRALYLQPTTDFVDTSRTITNSTGAISKGVNPSWGWGFQLEGSYHYNTGNDFNLNWYHFRNSSSRTLTGPVNYSGFTYTVGSPQLLNSAGTIDTAYSSSNVAWDQVNIEFAQHVDFGENKFARYHAGMNYSRVGNNGQVATAGSSTTPISSFNNNTTVTGVFNGFGPRVGLDLNYDWGNGLSVYGDGALSVLAGSSKASYYVVDGTTQNNWELYNFSRSNVVPELDAKLGFMYTYAMAQGDLSFDIGWLFTHYVGTFQTSSTDLLSTGSNFGIQGLYFGLKWVGNVA